jgi:hypothetical protein
MTKFVSALKVIMSIVAAFLLAAAGAAMANQVSIGTQGISLLQAVAGALLVFGFTPMVVSQAAGKALGAVSLVVSLALGYHWAFLDTMAATHHGVIIALHVVGFLNAVIAFVAHNQTPASAAAKLDQPPPS